MLFTTACKHFISLFYRICIALYKLASCAEYRVVAETFGVSKTTVHRCLYLFCNALTERKADYIKWYTAPEAKEMALFIEGNSSYPQAIGAIDGTHIAITPPAEGHADFINRKMYASIVLQAVVDGNFKFRDIYANTPGAAHDASVFHRSPLSQFIHTRMPRCDRMINGVSVPLHLLGDPAYPLSSFIIKGYTGRNISAEQESYNVYHSGARLCVEIAFGRLKSRWRILQKRMDVDFTFAPKVIICCCMLHSLCEDLKLAPPAPVGTNPGLEQPPPRTDTTADAEASSIREAIKNFLAETVPLRRSFYR